jgi:hypothetical protein
MLTLVRFRALSPEYPARPRSIAGHIATPVEFCRIPLNI